MPSVLRRLGCASIFLLVAHAAHAGIVVDNFGGVPTATWPASPDGIAVPAIVAATAPNSGTVSQTVATNTVIGQTFTVANSFTLGSVAWVGSGASNLSLGVHLFKFNAGSPYTPTSGGYVPATDFSGDLLGGGAGLTATYGGAGSDNVMFYNLTGSDEVTLTPGIYAFEVWNLNGAAGTLFPRRAGETYSGGSLYQVTDPNAQSITSTISRNTVVGGSTRDGIFAVYAAATPVPEASTVLFGSVVCGFLGLIKIGRSLRSTTDESAAG